MDETLGHYIEQRSLIHARDATTADTISVMATPQDRLRRAADGYLDWARTTTIVVESAYTEGDGGQYPETIEAVSCSAEDTQAWFEEIAGGTGITVVEVVQPPEPTEPPRPEQLPVMPEIPPAEIPPAPAQLPTAPPTPEQMSQLSIAEARRFLGRRPLVAATTFYLAEQRSKQATEQLRTDDGRFTTERGQIVTGIDASGAIGTVVDNISEATGAFAAEEGFDQTIEYDGEGGMIIRFYEKDDPDTPVIAVSRTVSNPTSMYHGGMAMLPPYLDKGHALRLNELLEGAYRESLVEIVRTDADTETGPYGYALQGWDFDSEDNPQSDLMEPWSKQQFIEAAERALYQLHGPGWRSDPDADAQMRAFQETLDRMALDPSARPVPLDYAMLGYTAGASTWFGKEMLTGEHAPAYRAVKRL